MTGQADIKDGFFDGLIDGVIGKRFWDRATREAYKTTSYISGEFAAGSVNPLAFYAEVVDLTERKYEGK